MMRQLLRYGMLWVAFFTTGPTFAQEPVPTRQAWSFSGLSREYDKAQLRRGLQVYEEKCRACHGMKYLTFRTLTKPGGPELTTEDAKTSPAAMSFRLFRMTVNPASGTAP